MAKVNQHLEEIKHIETIFFKKTAHPYLDRYIDKPVVDQDIILFLLEIIKTPAVTLEERREQILAALFTNAAFSTHDSVHNGTLEGGKKYRQLTVLAGDYFSSLYYSMLVDNGHVHILPVFSHSIQEINEAKMTLHFFHGRSEEDIVDRLYSEEGVLLRNIAGYYEEKELGIIAETFFLLKKLNKEKETLINKPLSSFQAAIHLFAEGEMGEKVNNWPTSKTSNFLEDRILELQRDLNYRLESSDIRSTPIYNRLTKWTGDGAKVWTK